MMADKGAYCHISAKNVPDANIGMHFEDYLPEDGSYILIDKKDDPNPIVAEVILKEENKIYDGRKYKAFILVFKDFLSGKYYKIDDLNGTWKYLLFKKDILDIIKGKIGRISMCEMFEKSIIYMEEDEILVKDVLIHGMIFKEAAVSLADVLEKEGNPANAFELLKRASECMHVWIEKAFLYTNRNTYWEEYFSTSKCSLSAYDDVCMIPKMERYLCACNFYSFYIRYGHCNEISMQKMLQHEGKVHKEISSYIIKIL